MNRSLLSVIFSNLESCSISEEKDLKNVFNITLSNKITLISITETDEFWFHYRTKIFIKNSKIELLNVIHSKLYI
jgi:hypothetical protein